MITPVHLHFASPREDLAALIGEAALLLDRPDSELAALAGPIAETWERFRDTCLAPGRVESDLEPMEETRNV